ncbi:putative transporter [Fusarium culmorum]|uniref:Putative transporter n=1 Tax=Fusarium culmorum TaxID=5516 RepID=A0A2T4GRL2_FUSCU|nr:putative transporter [Fusarium culmorum]
MSTEKNISSVPQGNHFSVHAKMSHEENRLKNKESENGVVDHETPEWKQSEKSLVHKLDMTLMPMVWILYMFNYIDRNNIAQARLDDFKADLGLVNNRFNIAVSILNVGYMLAQLPSNMILTRVRPSIYLPSCVIVWSCVSAATAGVTSFSGLIAVRFVLGIVEAPFFPGAFFMLSSWYTRKELALRTAGAGSVVAAILAFILLPDFPKSTTGSQKWLLTDHKRQVAIRRIALDRVSLPETDRSLWNGLGLAVKDIRTWIFVIILCANHTAYGIVRSMNLGNRTITLVLTAPPYLFGAAVSFLAAYLSDRFNERGYHISVPMVFAIIGFIISVATLNNAARYAASFFYCAGAFAANAAVYSWAASSLNQTPEKRACATAIVNLLSQLGNIWSPYFFPASDGPRYVMAMLLMMAFSVLSIVASLLIKFLLKKDNRKLLAEAEQSGRAVKLYTT